MVEKELQGFEIESTNKLNIFTITINFEKVLKAAQALGVMIISIGASDLKNGTPHLVLGILWQVIRIGLNKKLQQQSKGASSTSKNGNEQQNEFEPLIKEWVEEQTLTTVNNIGGDFSDGTILLTLMYKIAKDTLLDIPFDLDEEMEKGVENRIERAMQLTDELGIERFLRVSDVSSGNPKLIFTLLAEIFAISVQNDVGVVDRVASLSYFTVGKHLQDQNQLGILRFCSYKNHMHFDNLRAGGLIDPIEIAVFISEYSKDVIQMEGLKMSPQIIDNVSYQMLVNGIPDYEINNLLIKVLLNLRDVLDELQQLPITVRIEQHLFILFKCLMIWASEENQRMLMGRTDFGFLIDKLSQKRLSVRVTLPLLFYLHEMSLVTCNYHYDEIAKSFIDKIDEDINEIKSLDQKSAFIYICQQIKIGEDQLINEHALSLIKQALQQQDEVQTIVVTAMLFEVIQNKINAQQAIEILQLAQIYIISMKDGKQKCLLQLQFAQLIENLIQKFPNEVASFLIQHKLAEQGMKEILEPNINMDIEDQNNQISLLSYSIILKALKKQIPKIQNQNIQSQILKMYSTEKTPKEMLILTYSNIIEGNLGNDIMRQTARNATEAFMILDNNIVKSFTKTFNQVAKSSSITGFLQSLLDVEMCQKVIEEDDDMMIQIFNLVLSCLQKYETNVIVVEKVIDTYIRFSNSQLLVSSDAFEQLDAFIEDLLSDRPIISKYLELVTLLAQKQRNIIMTCSTALQRCLQLHGKDSYIMILWFQCVKEFQGVKYGKLFCDEVNFWEIAKEKMGDFASSREVMLQIIGACEALAGGSADCCIDAYDYSIFKELRQYGRFWTRHPQIVDCVMRAHMWAFWYIDTFNVIQDEHDVLDELGVML